MAMRATVLAGAGAGAQGFIKDRFDRARATPAFRAAAKATVKLLGKDSVVKRSILADSLGKFSFDGLAAGQYILQVQSLSFGGFNRDIVLNRNDKMKQS